MTGEDPWAFGLDHLLTIIGFIITALIAIAGFSTFGKWKREKIEEKRIDIALEALALAYEARSVFEAIRSPMTFAYEYDDAPDTNEDRKRKAGPYFAVLKRIERNKEFFERIWSLQPRFMAVFGKDTEATFRELHKARRSIEVSAGMLMNAALNNDVGRDTQLNRQMKADIWGMDATRNQVGDGVDAFITGVEKLCVPVVVYGYARSN